MSEIETFSNGSPLDYAIDGVSELSSKDRRSHNDLSIPINDSYGVDIDSETAGVIKRLYTSVDGIELVKAVKNLGLDEVDDYESLLKDFDTDDAANLHKAMEVIDCKLSESIADREKDATAVSKKHQRSSVYIPELINKVAGTGGTVYMAKTLTTTAKVEMAWDLHDSNEVVVVDDYKWGRLLGWEKLKSFPHGKNKIREEYGDRLSPELLDRIAGSSNDTDTSSDTSSPNSRRTRTKPTNETINVAPDSSHRKRFKRQSKDIKESFDDDGWIGSEYNKVDMLILFPTTADRNLSSYYWVAGSKYNGANQAAVANCNKGTFDYLKDCDEVYHIEEYLSEAGDYEFQTNHGPVTLDTIDQDNLVIHVVSEKTKSRLLRKDVLENMPKVLPDYCEDQLFRSPDLPHCDDMLYAPISMEDVFWMRPLLREMKHPDEGDGCILYANDTPRDIGQSWCLSSDYKLYARARLPNWDFDGTELSTLDSASYSLDIDDGGYELVETLGKLHDSGAQPFSETPESRWSQ